MSNVTELATGQLTATDAVVIELVEANEAPPWSSSDGRPKRQYYIPECFRSLLISLPHLRCCGRAAGAYTTRAEAMRRPETVTNVNPTAPRICARISTGPANCSVS
jgi:hypothetical protein